MEDLFGALPPPANDSGNSAGERGTDSDNKEVSRKRVIENQPNDQLDSAIKKVKSDDVRTCYQLKGYIGERRGEREDMQDAHVIIDDMTSCLQDSKARVAYYGVFDGHSGSRASQYAAENLHKVIVEKFPKGGEEPQLIKRCLVESFKKTDADFLTLAAKATPHWKDGSTAAVVMAIDNVIYSSNLGDSKATLYRRDPSTKEIHSIPLTKDHTPANIEERKRIEKAGGFVREGRVMGIVEVSRSIGDGRFKGCGVICIPHVFRCELTENDMFIVVACDGLWNVFSREEVGQFILKIINDETLLAPEDNDSDRLTADKSNTAAGTVLDYRSELACNRIAVEAVKRGCTDNVTVLLINIDSSSCLDN